jgi:peptidoglycan/LPS O-acetylase OafA/YrhL
MEGKRIDFLDGLRGVAIVLVVLFHAYSRWPSIVPYGDKFASFPVFKNGYLGVQLFFLISGFVILMSLEKNTSFFTFLYKRWLRLFPAMLIATVLVFATAAFLYERPAGQPSLSAVIPGLLFLEPDWIKLATGFQIEPLEGAFWSLFVEVKFYFIFGFLYFSLDKTKAIIGLTLLYLASIYLTAYPVRYLSLVSTLLSLQYFGWFAGGCAAYLFFKNRELKYLLFAMVMAATELYLMKAGKETFFFGIVLLGLFILPIYFEKWRVLFANRFLFFFGFISYPLYLVHENAMIAMIVKLHKYSGVIPDILLPIIPILILAGITYFIAAKAEPYVKKIVQR